MYQPKKKWLLPEESKTMKAECSEESIQDAYEEYLEWKKIDRIRIPDKLFAIIKSKTIKGPDGRYTKMFPEWFQKWFFGMFGGRPDDTLIIPLGKGYALSFQIELKTQDSKGRAVGKLHGKQTHHEDEWVVCRSIDAAMAETEKFIGVAEDIKKYLRERYN